VDRDTVAPWIKQWEKHGEQSLHDQPRSGRPSTLNATEKELAKQYMQEEPRSLKHVVERFAQKQRNVSAFLVQTSGKKGTSSMEACQEILQEPARSHRLCPV